MYSYSRARLAGLEGDYPAALNLMRDAVALDVKRTCSELAKVEEQQKSSFEAAKSATENRELNVRAYQEELVETKDVIEAQIMEALLSAQYQQVLYSHVEAVAKLDMATGVEPWR